MNQPTTPKIAAPAYPERLEIRITRAQAQAVYLKAHAEGRSTASVMRELIDKHLRAEVVLSPDEVAKLY